MKKITEIKKAKLNAFARITKEVAKAHGPNAIKIENSRMAQHIGHRGFIVDINFNGIFGKGFNMDFSVSMNAINQLSSLKATKGVTIFEDDDAFIFRGEHTQAYLPKPAITASCLPAPIFTDNQRVGEDLTDLDYKGIKSSFYKKGFVQLNCFDNQLEQMVQHGNNPYTFFISPMELIDEGRKPNLYLTSQRFLELAKELDFSLGIRRNDHGYWLRTQSRHSLIGTVVTYENVFEGQI